MLLCSGLMGIWVYAFSSPRAKGRGPRGLRAESARAVTGRRCPCNGVGEDFLVHRHFFLTKTDVSRKRTRSVVNVGYFLVARKVPPSFVDHDPKLRVLVIGHWTYW